jgi:hypothetical protein
MARGRGFPSETSRLLLWASNARAQAVGSAAHMVPARPLGKLLVRWEGRQFRPAGRKGGAAVNRHVSRLKGFEIDRATYAVWRHVDTRRTWPRDGSPDSATKFRCKMANLERGFRRLTLAFSVLFASPFLVDGVLSSFETGRIHYFLLVPTTIGFVLPWLVFFVARWITAGFRAE